MVNEKEKNRYCETEAVLSVGDHYCQKAAMGKNVYWNEASLKFNGEMFSHHC